MKKHYRFTVGGTVQGVGFRLATREAATHLGLDGWVRNCADGRVEGCVAGDTAQLARFHEFLKLGPPAACVEEVAWEATGAETDLHGFNIRRTW
ncbi:MAG: acylphosphatase [Sinobacteraceae bacterium]|nr:acylphosphatase [Nevskiaceae bacterium]